MKNVFNISYKTKRSISKNHGNMIEILVSEKKYVLRNVNTNQID